ncbi:MBL fold metallo-hydrolase [Cellulomonas endophytica]|uniref:MBL fold metallo-hydrolase n=1 Tax=Cellulomonas endophytica TaxID=2494735 RepID=UPI0010120343|nr:MBL fold metallo-hydrolase [Cellulomonas endophytica]
MPRTLRTLADGVLVATSRTDATTTTVLVRGGRAVLVDPAWWPDELDALAADLGAHGLSITAGWSTHAHEDHVLWHPGFGTAPRWATPRAAARAAADRTALLAALGPAFDRPDLRALVGAVRGLPGDRVPQPFGTDGPDEPLLVVAHDGHAPGHGALWAPERGLLVAGDVLSDVELPLPFDPDDLEAYRAGLDVLAPVVARARVLVPGHGTPTDRPLERLDADRRYLDAVLAGRPVDDPRLGRPGMAAAHARTLALARGG